MKNPITTLGNEYRYYKSFSSDIQRLLIANFLYTFSINFMNFFVNAYIYSKTDNATVLIYNFGVYLGLPIIFILNGFLLKKFEIQKIYSVGMVASVSVIFYVMLLEEVNAVIFFFSGIVIGLAYGLHWANRNFMIQNSTTNESRNYYTGIEFLLATVVNLITPALAGLFIEYGPSIGYFSKDTAYQLLIGVILIISSIAAVIIYRGQFQAPKIDQFLFFKFGDIWKKMQLFSFLKGSIQGAQAILPSLLILNLVGEEGALGIIVSISAAISAIVCYVTGRISKPTDRVKIFTASVIFFLVGAITHSLVYSALSVLIWQFLQNISDPISYLAYNPIFYRSMDVAGKEEKRHNYTYIVNNEIMIMFGRVLGILIFLGFHYYISDVFALRHFLTVIGVIQILSIFVAKKLPK